MRASLIFTLLFIPLLAVVSPTPALAQCYRPCPTGYYVRYAPVPPSCYDWYNSGPGAYADEMDRRRGDRSSSRKTAGTAKRQRSGNKEQTHYTSSLSRKADEKRSDRSSSAVESKTAKKQRTQKKERPTSIRVGNKELMPLEPQNFDLPEPQSY